MKKTDSPIIIEEDLQTSVPILWSALTDHERMLKWYFDNIPDFKPKVGFETSFKVQSEDRTFTHLWKITEVIPLQKISYSWTFKEYDGCSISHFELFEKEDAVQLRLTVNTLEDFPSDIPEFKVKSCIGGWNYFISERLKPFVEKR